MKKRIVSLFLVLIIAMGVITSNVMPSKALDANEKVIKIKNMMSEAQYQDAGSQEMLQGYLDAA